MNTNICKLIYGVAMRYYIRGETWRVQLNGTMPEKGMVS